MNNNQIKNKIKKNKNRQDNMISRIIIGMEARQAEKGIALL